MSKVCMVIMGFGKKTDYSTGRTLDLDKTYSNIIQPALKQVGVKSIRADEIQESGIIDKSMYVLLMHADLVIADISTFNPNAIYELGIRHAVRPYATIILKEVDGKIPFDLDHNRIFKYSHLGEDIGADEARRCISELSSLISSVLSDNKVDSPLYEYVNPTQPKIDKAIIDSVIKCLAKREKSLYAITEQAKKLMADDDLLGSELLWKKACEISPNEKYFVQQWALTKYKSKKPSPIIALNDALQIISKIDNDLDVVDPETLGILGAINKNLYLETRDLNYLQRAIEFYGKGFLVRNDYYTGENYALCLNLMAKNCKEEEISFNVISAKKAREKIVMIIKPILLQEEKATNKRIDYKWLCATMAHCLFFMGDKQGGKLHESLFLKEKPLEWEIDTYKKNKEIIISNGF